jgi:hypothetical protein
LKARGSRAHVAVREQCPVGVGDQGGEGCSWGEWDSAESKEKLGTQPMRGVLSGLCRHIDTDLEGMRFAGNYGCRRKSTPSTPSWCGGPRWRGKELEGGDSAESEERLWV